MVQERFSLPTINDLPYRCLRTIFGFLPLQDLIQIGLVCRKWYSLQWTAFCHRRSLKILVGKDALDLAAESRFSIPHLEEVVEDDTGNPLFKSLENNHIQTHYLNASMVHFLADSFPNITHLEVALKEMPSSSIDHVIYLLQFWFRRLVTLKIYCRFPSEVKRSTVSERLFRLLQSINGLPTVRSLTLAFDNRFILSNEANINYQIYLPVLARLEEFYFYSTDPPDVLLDSLLRFGRSNARLKRLGIANFVDINNAYNLAAFHQLPQSIIDKFDRLFVMKPPIDARELVRFCSVYTGLRSIQIYNIQLSLSQLANILAPLKSLIHLGFAIKFFKRPSLSADDVLPTRKLPQLPSIRVLTLSVSLKSHADIHSVHLGHIFPELQVLVVGHDFFYCIECRCDHYRKTSKSRCRECMSLLLRPWAVQCRKLRKIYTMSYRKVTEWSVAELCR